MPEGPNSAYDVGRGLSQAFPSGGPLFPVAFLLLPPAAYFLSTATKSMQKAPPETNGLWTPFTFKNYRSLWAVAGTDSATDPLPLPLRRRSVWVYGFEYGFPRRVYAPARNDRIIL